MMSRAIIDSVGNWGDTIKVILLEMCLYKLYKIVNEP